MTQATSASAASAGSAQASTSASNASAASTATQVDSWDEEDSKIAYYCGPCYSDVRQIVTTVLGNIRGSIDGQTALVTNAWKGAKAIPVVGAVAELLLYTYWICASSMMLLAGISICLFMLLPHLICVAIVQLVGLAGLAISKQFEAIHNKLHHISQVCNHCHERFSDPVYICPKCGARHAHLVPNQYGAFHHTCTCGVKLACSYLVVKNPRKDMQGLCPNCLRSGREETVTGADSRTICVPVIGARSSGKTSLITAYANDVIEKRARLNKLTTEFYDETDRQLYSDMTKSYSSGVVKQTLVQKDKDKESAFSFSFYLKGSGLKPNRLIQLYDIAGESFTKNEFNERQSQFNHCDGIVLVIDPMSLQQAEGDYSDQLVAADKGTSCPENLQTVQQALFNIMNEVNDDSRSNKKSRIPLAVVLNKIDEAPGLQERLGEDVIKTLRRKDTENKFADDYDAMDFLCRQFFTDMDEEGFVKNIESSFSNGRFFAVSAIGHSAGVGSESFEPRNVDLVMDWIMDQSDARLAKAMGCATFSKAKLPSIKPRTGLLKELTGKE